MLRKYPFKSFFPERAWEEGTDHETDMEEIYYETDNEIQTEPGNPVDERDRKHRGVYDGLLLTQYIHTCVVDRVQDGDTEVVDELCSIIQKLMR